MIEKDQCKIVKTDAGKLLDAIALVQVSVKKLPAYDSGRDYTADAREPYV